MLFRWRCCALDLISHRCGTIIAILGSKLHLMESARLVIDLSTVGGQGIKQTLRLARQVWLVEGKRGACFRAFVHSFSTCGPTGYLRAWWLKLALRSGKIEQAIRASLPLAPLGSNDLSVKETPPIADTVRVTYGRWLNTYPTSHANCLSVVCKASTDSCDAFPLRRRLGRLRSEDGKADEVSSSRNPRGPGDQTWIEIIDGTANFSGTGCCCFSNVLFSFAILVAVGMIYKFASLPLRRVF